ncbi:hypothetical protein PG985_001610 [Apiospora marii]|uniref:uncharacterized protein n=1 Tax=Apiospora marii TaxID=335849 RepID=UPI00312CDDF1
MAPWSLPNELTIAIMENLAFESRKQLPDLATVCPAWRAVIESITFRNVRKEYKKDNDPVWSFLESTIPPSPWRLSLDQSYTLKLYDISLGLKRLRLYKNVRAGIEIFGPNLGDDPAAEWPLLEEFDLHYDQCIDDAIESPTKDSQWSDFRPALEKAEELVWQASAAAAQRMPRLRTMRLTGYPVNRDFSFFARTVDPRPDGGEEPDVEVVWSGHGAADWRPSNKVLRAWHAIAARKRGSALRVSIKEDSEVVHKGYFPTCVDGMPVSFSESQASWKVEDWSDDWDADPH